ncbi:uncharacterized protein LOC111402943 [Olea europaea var. sylvestris]|uniref:uncharacterized protein LOC111402943 n=1 Tax=Olea europaea var. sylvestris TaxID=158386 RepID=UPI000C1D4969|nr:uncharacterized protein LOC111402943 [Olea europaea var. sylvestris]
MLEETFLLKCLSALILIQLLQTSSARHNPQCNPSACGRISNISYPFRLTGDAEHCGDSSYELVCDDNITSLYLNSRKYHVQAINYHNCTIRLVDAALKNDNCSLPQCSLFQYNFTNNFPYTIYSKKLKLNKSIMLAEVESRFTFMSWPYYFNSSVFSKTASCSHKVYASNDSYSSTGRYIYVKASDLNLTDVGDMCSIDLTVMTSWPFKEVNNLSHSDIRGSMLYGFEISWFTVQSSICRMNKHCSVYVDNRGSIQYYVGIISWKRVVTDCKESFPL